MSIKSASHKTMSNPELNIVSTDFLSLSFLRLVFENSLESFTMLTDTKKRSFTFFTDTSIYKLQLGQLMTSFLELFAIKHLYFSSSIKSNTNVFSLTSYL